MIGEQLPPAWRRVKFGEVVREVKQTTKDPQADGIERVVGLDHLDRESLPLRRWDELSDLPDGTSFTRIFKAGQVLFGKRRAYQRKVAVPDFDGMCSSDILVFESSSPDLLPEFLPYLVQSDGFFDHALGTSAGSLSPRTKWQDLARHEFALPPLDEQRSIVDLLDTTRVVNESLVVAHAAQEGLLQAALNEWKFASDLYPQAPLGAVVDLQPGRQRSPKYQSGTCPRPYLRAANLKLDRLDLTDVLEMDFSETELSRYEVRAGDVLLVEGGDADAVGAPAFVAEELPSRTCIQNTVIRARVRPDRDLDARFLYWQLRGCFRAREFERIATGTKLYHLGLRKLTPFVIPLPPRDVQTRVVKRLDQVDAVRIRLAQTQANLRLMESSLREHLLSVAQP